MKKAVIGDKFALEGLGIGEILGFNKKEMYVRFPDLKDVDYAIEFGDAIWDEVNKRYTLDPNNTIEFENTEELSPVDEDEISRPKPASLSKRKGDLSLQQKAKNRITNLIVRKYITNDDVNLADKELLKLVAERILDDI